MVRKTPLERFNALVNKTEECWEWTGALDTSGYGRFWMNGKSHSAHRVAITLAGISFITNTEVDHLCRNRKCVNVEHLEQVSDRTNSLRSNNVGGINSRKTHCPRGHELAGYNCMILKTSGSRTCRTCHNIRTNEGKKRRRKEKEAVQIASN